MRIRYGYDLAFFCAAPVVVLTQLDAHPEVAHRVATMGQLDMTPAIETTTFTDAFGNDVRRFLAPAGMTRMTRDSVYECDGSPQEVAHDAGEVPLETLPCAYFTYLVGSRYCEVDRLSGVAWQLFGHTPRGWPRVQAICDFVERHMTFGYRVCPKHAYGLRGLRGACRRLPRLRASRRRAVPGDEHPGALRQRLHGQHRPPLRTRCTRTTTPGSRPISTIAGTSSTPATTCRASAGSPWLEAAMRRTSRSSPRSGRTT